MYACSNDNAYSIIFLLELNYVLKLLSQIKVVKKVTEMYFMGQVMEK